jgi:glycosyltransferase involved in cell wall biosynthesis
MPDLSVIIVNWNVRDLLRRCLHSILANLPACQLEIIVVDNGSTDGSPEMVRTEFPQVHLDGQSRQPGLYGGQQPGAGGRPGPLCPSC